MNPSQLREDFLKLAVDGLEGSLGSGGGRRTADSHPGAIRDPAILGEKCV